MHDEPSPITEPTAPRIAPASGFITSESITELAASLAKAQGEFANPAKDKTAKVRLKAGGEYSFNYADLASVMDAIRSPLARNGLAVIQAPQVEYFESAALVTLTTRLLHSSGQWIETKVSIGADEQRAQVVASAITYAKRYAIQALLGVVAEEDDDGNAASGNSASIQSRHPRQQEQPKQPAPAASNPAATRFDKARASLIAKMGADEAEHQIAAIKRKHGETTPAKLKALEEIEALDSSIKAPL